MICTHPLGYRCDAKTGAVYGKRGLPIGQRAGNGYVAIATSEGGKRVRRYAHRIMYEAANGPIPEGMDVNHKNGIKTDNRLSNLEVVSRSANILHAYRTGLNCGRGRRLSDEQAELVRATVGSVTGKEWSRRLGVAESVISSVRRNKRYVQHGAA